SARSAPILSRSRRKPSINPPSRDRPETFRTEFRSIRVKRAIMLLGALTLTVGCGGAPLHAATTAAPTASPSASATASPTTSASASSAPVCARAQSYGLLISSGSLDLISPLGCVAATVAVRPAAAHSCGDGLDAAAPSPVSASDNKVYYRDGDTQIRFIAPDGTSGTVTTGPGGA